MPSRLLRTLVLVSPVLLAACGEGYEMQRVSGIVPYTQPRTAGTGVAYVRAKMMPEKAIVVQPEMTPIEAPVEKPAEPLQSAEPVFEKKMRK